MSDFKSFSSEIQDEVNVNVTAALRGYAAGQCKVGKFYEHHLGSNQVGVRGAFNWFSLAAKNGNINAQYKLGCMYIYYNGNFVEKCKSNGQPIRIDKLQKAFYWFTQAAEQGHVKAQYRLGEWYQEKSLIDNESFLAEKIKHQNDYMKKAIFWYDKAYAQGYGLSSEKNEFLKIKKVFSDFQGFSVEIQNEVILSVREAVRGSSIGQCKVGRLYECHLGSNVVGVQDAFTWFILAAKNGNLDAQYKLGCMYQTDNRNVEGKWFVCNDEMVRIPNLQAALHWFTKAAENGHMHSQCKLGNLSEVSDIEKAIFWYAKGLRINK